MAVNTTAPHTMSCVSREVPSPPQSAEPVPRGRSHSPKISAAAHRNDQNTSVCAAPRGVRERCLWHQAGRTGAACSGDRGETEGTLYLKARQALRTRVFPAARSNADARLADRERRTVYVL